MPYFLFRIKPFGQLEKLSEFSTFQDASAQAKALRAAADAPGKVKIMFAENEFQAEELLSQIRTPGPIGDD